jgi:hypothetical protein
MEEDKAILVNGCIDIKWGKTCIFRILVQYLKKGFKMIIKRNKNKSGKLPEEGINILEGYR